MATKLQKAFSCHYRLYHKINQIQKTAIKNAPFRKHANSLKIHFFETFMKQFNRSFAPYLYQQ